MGRNITVIIVTTSCDEPQIFTYLQTLTIHMHIDQSLVVIGCVSNVLQG